jgi:hypothetical protein
MALCPFYKSKNFFISTFAKAFGKPGEGVHNIIFFNTAIIDYVISIVFAILISIFTKIPLVLTTILVLIMGIILHILFGINTNSVNYLGLSCNL